MFLFVAFVASHAVAQDPAFVVGRNAPPPLADAQGIDRYRLPDAPLIVLHADSADAWDAIADHTVPGQWLTKLLRAVWATPKGQEHWRRSPVWSAAPWAAWRDALRHGFTWIALPSPNPSQPHGVLILPCPTPDDAEQLDRALPVAFAGQPAPARFEFVPEVNAADRPDALPRLWRARRPAFDADGRPRGERWYLTNAPDQALALLEGDIDTWTPRLRAAPWREDLARFWAIASSPPPNGNTPDPSVGTPASVRLWINVDRIFQVLEFLRPGTLPDVLDRSDQRKTPWALQLHCSAGPRREIRYRLEAAGDWDFPAHPVPPTAPRADNVASPGDARSRLYVHLAPGGLEPHDGPFWAGQLVDAWCGWTPHSLHGPVLATLRQWRALTGLHPSTPPFTGLTGEAVFLADGPEPFRPDGSWLAVAAVGKGDVVLEGWTRLRAWTRWRADALWNPNRAVDRPIGDTSNRPPAPSHDTPWTDGTRPLAVTGRWRGKEAPGGMSGWVWVEPRTRDAETSPAHSFSATLPLTTAREGWADVLRAENVTLPASPPARETTALHIHGNPVAPWLTWDIRLTPGDARLAADRFMDACVRPRLPDGDESAATVAAVVDSMMRSMLVDMLAGESGALGGEGGRIVLEGSGTGGALAMATLATRLVDALSTASPAPDTTPDFAARRLHRLLGMAQRYRASGLSRIQPRFDAGPTAPAAPTAPGAWPHGVRELAAGVAEDGSSLASWLDRTVPVGMNDPISPGTLVTDIALGLAVDDYWFMERAMETNPEARAHADGLWGFWALPFPPPAPEGGEDRQAVTRAHALQRARAHEWPMLHIFKNGAVHAYAIPSDARLAAALDDPAFPANASSLPFSRFADQREALAALRKIEEAKKP